jgi:hypothetical protein
MRDAGGHCRIDRIDLYLMQPYDEAAARMYGPGRLAAIHGSLAPTAWPWRPARIEIVRLR